MASNVITLNGQGTVISNGSITAAGALFWPLTGWIPAAQVNTARGVLEMRANTSNAKCAPAWQTANDVDSPDAATALGTGYFTGTGVNYPSGYDTLSISGKQFIRFGVNIFNSTGSLYEACWARIKIDIQGA